MAFKRRFKKRGGRGKRQKPIKRITPLAIAKASMGKRKYVYEDRSKGMVGARNVITYRAPFTSEGTGDHNDMETILSATGLTTLGGVNDSAGTQYWVGNQLVTYCLRNLEHEASVVTVYIFKNLVDVYKEDLTVDIDSPGEKLIADLVQGWDQFASAGDVNLAGTGTYVQYTQGDREATVTYDFLHPAQSVGFYKKWGLVKKSTKKLMPGDDWEFNIKIPNNIYDPFLYEDLSGQQTVGGYTDLGYLMLKAGKGRFVVFKNRGVMGKSDADHTIYGYMSTNHSVALKQTAQVLKLQQLGHSLAMSGTKDADAADLRSPSEFVMVTDDADD